MSPATRFPLDGAEQRHTQTRRTLELLGAPEDAAMDPRAETGRYAATRRSVSVIIGTPSGVRRLRDARRSGTPRGASPRRIPDAISGVDPCYPARLWVDWGSVESTSECPTHRRT